MCSHLSTVDMKRLLTRSHRHTRASLIIEPIAIVTLASVMWRSSVALLFTILTTRQLATLSAGFLGFIGFNHCCQHISADEYK